MSGIAEHWFWWLVTMACVVWYSTITLYVTVKGTADIKGMLKRLGALQDAEAPADPTRKRT
jgi:hypothetical protein